MGQEERGKGIQYVEGGRGGDLLLLSRLTDGSIPTNQHTTLEKIETYGKQTVERERDFNKC